MAPRPVVQASVFRHKEVGGPAVQGIQQGCVDDVIRTGKRTELLFEIRLGEAAHFVEGLELVELAERDVAAMLIPIPPQVSRAASCTRTSTLCLAAMEVRPAKAGWTV